MPGTTAPKLNAFFDSLSKSGALTYVDARGDDVQSLKASIRDNLRAKSVAQRQQELAAQTSGTFAGAMPTYESVLNEPQISQAVRTQQPAEYNTAPLWATPEDLFWRQDDEEESKLPWAKPWESQSDFDDMLLPQFKSGEQGPWDELLELWEGIGTSLPGGANAGTMDIADPDGYRIWEEALSGADDAGANAGKDLSVQRLDSLLPDGVNVGDREIANPEMFANWLKLQEEPENREAAASLLDKFRDYQERTARQMLLGKYTDDVTLLGTLNQMGLGVLDLDLPMDIRDLTYDLTHLDSTPWWQTALDAVALVPYVGAVKYVDDLDALAKGAARYGDEVGDLVEGAAKSTGKAEDIINSATEGAGDVKKIITKIEYKPSSGVIFKANPDKTTTILGSR
jgi:hypothetical protein